MTELDRPDFWEFYGPMPDLAKIEQEVEAHMDRCTYPAVGYGWWTAGALTTRGIREDDAKFMARADPRLLMMLLRRIRELEASHGS